jgi:hypothetical protein
VTEQNTIVTIYVVSKEHPIGRLIWNDSTLLAHYSIGLLSQYLGFETGIFEQLSLKIGDCRDELDRMSKTWLYLLEYRVDAKSFGKPSTGSSEVA